ncbi:Homoserine dehydrogenase [Candidatus Syntrophocurvum alkaliphilum]|uniref:Homoserine dehydrogenase n=1 Tax=Candidatus Syntrophocurvum alkaliphilum TaxID=2293317 RepID=A0A6I6DC42_9FIRM|nr:homoserine dehydrogenase [Candidatus Syntrophocurvum alkaliphilum]QGT99829.1 Homoserine dehydrogenase [Candidatus Syntrophocurvum alkaliphilum]
MINIGLLGCGTVGSGVVKLLEQNGETILKKTGKEIRIKKILERDVEKCLELGFAENCITEDIKDIVDDPEIDIIVELLGGISPADEFIIEAMEKGKHVVTANKDLIAVKGQDIFDTAENQKVDFYFEASVAGGIPAVTPLKQSLAGNNIEEVIGILNGTTNYILTKMSREGQDFDDVLKEAQDLGYAEADPSSDVYGLDAARKIAILASIAFNSRVMLDDVYVEGITSINAVDMEYAKELGLEVKLLAIAKQEEGQIQVRVHPAFIPIEHPLASVNGVYNAVFIKGDAVGDIMHYGSGAGQMPTASAVVGDIIEIVRNKNYNSNARIGCTCYDQKPILNINQLEGQFYIRMAVKDRPGALAGIAGVFGNNNVSLSSVLQKTNDWDMAELILITHNTSEQNLRDALAVLKGMSIVGEINNVIRLEGMDKK